jgi:hypothetical protein
MSDTQRKVEKMLKDEGFTMVRVCGSGHKIWSDGKVRLTIGSSLSDRRAFQNVKADIRRARRQAEEHARLRGNRESQEKEIAV